MDIYQTEDEQVEALKKWWSENGKSAIFGVVLGLGAIFGWREWQDYQTDLSASASQLYEQMVLASRENNSEVLAEKAEEISRTFAGTSYAVFAKMALAKIAVSKGELDKAASDLQWAMDNTSQASLRHVITIRLARVFIAQNRYDEANALLESTTDRGEFAVSYLELEADILRLENDITGARQAYEKALGMAKTAGLDTTILDMKLDDLGRN